MGYLFHGSANYIEKDELIPYPSKILNGKEAVFGTDNYFVACIFGVKWTNKDFEFGCENGAWYLKEQYENAFEKFKTSCWVYKISNEGFYRDDRLGMKNEFINHNKVQIIKKTKIEDIWHILQHINIKLIYFGYFFRAFFYKNPFRELKKNE